MNYGEVLAYWYLRFNGFFPIVDFVLHGVCTNGGDRDVDILAVRPPFVVEDVGGQPGDWDSQLFAPEFLGDVNDIRYRGLIVEVTTGRERQNLESRFSRDYLDYAIKRLGFVEQSASVALSDELVTRAAITGANFTIGKLVISRTRWVDGRYHVKSLIDISGFIRNRLTRYQDEKQRSRIYFHDPLIQFMIDSDLMQ